MPITFNSPSGITKRQADQDYWLDVNGKVTTDTEEAHQLLIRKGQDVPKELADKYGIGKVATKEEAESETVEKAAKPSENKSKTPK